jgi:hypothetical protein
MTATSGSHAGETVPMDQQKVTVQQAFDAMRLFLKRFNEREPLERRITIEQLLRWMDQEAWASGGTYDPAQWHDWLAAVESAVGRQP